MKKTLLTCLLASCTFSVYAQNMPNQNQTNINSMEIRGYVIDSWGHPVRASDGSCVRTGSYDKATAYHPECDIQPKRVVQIEPMVIPGSPPPIPEVQPQKQIVAAHENINIVFGFNSSKLNQESKHRIDQLLLQNYHNNTATITIEAGADFIGSEKYNDKLSARRAQSIAEYINQQKIAGLEVVAIDGVGESKAKQQNTVQCEEVSHNKKALIECIAPDRFGSVTLHFNR